MVSKYPTLPLVDLVTIHDTKRKPITKSKRISGIYPYYGASGITDYVEGYVFDGLYVLLAEDGDNLRTRNTPIAFTAKGKFWVNNHAHVLKGLDDLDTQYICYALQHAEIDSYISGSTRPKITQGDLKKIPITAPPLETRHKIAKLVNEFDQKIELNRQTNQTLEQMAQALFKSWFVDFDPVFDNALGAGTNVSDFPEALQHKAEQRKQAQLLPDFKALPDDIHSLFPGEFKESELGWIPKDWAVKPANEIANIAIGKTPPRKQQEWFSSLREGNVVWVSIRDMGAEATFIGDSREYLTPESISKFNVKVVPQDSVILSFKLTLGRVCITSCELATNEAIAHFVSPKFGLTKEYVYSYLKTFNYDLLGSTSSIATAVNSKIIKEMPFLVPPASIIKEYNQIIEKIFDKKQKISEQNKNLEEMRDTLLPKLISGEITINKEVA